MKIFNCFKVRNSLAEGFRNKNFPVDLLHTGASSCSNSQCNVVQGMMSAIGNTPLRTFGCLWVQSAKNFRCLSRRHLDICHPEGTNAMFLAFTKCLVNPLWPPPSELVWLSFTPSSHSAPNVILVSRFIQSCNRAKTEPQAPAVRSQPKSNLIQNKFRLLASCL